MPALSSNDGMNIIFCMLYLHYLKLFLFCLGFSPYPPTQIQYPSGSNQPPYPPVGHQTPYPPAGNQNTYVQAYNPSQPYQHDQYNMYQRQQYQGNRRVQNPSYPPPYSPGAYGQVVQQQPNAYQQPPKVLAGKIFFNV